MAKATNDNGDCSRLHQIEAVLRDQLTALDVCGSSVAGAYLAQALEALEEDLRKRCGKHSDARQATSSGARRNIFRSS